MGYPITSGVDSDGDSSILGAVVKIAVSSVDVRAESVGAGVD